MPTLEELVKQLAVTVDKLAEENCKVAATTDKVAATTDKVAATMDKLAEEHRQYSAERRAAELKSDEGWEKVRLSQEKSDEGFAKLRKDLDDLRKSHRRTESFFDSQWGKMMEALVNNQVVPLLQSRGFSVNHTNQRVKGKQANGHSFEFDIIAVNGDSIVVVEVKTTLRPEHVPHFLDKLGKLKTWLPRYSELKLYGAVAFLREESESEANAAKAGLFTILATGSGASITNTTDFKPKEF